jgi:hypothetical protein
LLECGIGGGAACEPRKQENGRDQQYPCRKMKGTPSQVQLPARIRKSATESVGAA